MSNLLSETMEPSSSRKRKLTADERTIKNRERNKSHARKTRERKKVHMMAFSSRIKELEDEATDLRSRVDARYTASVLLGLGGSTSSSTGADGAPMEILNASMVTGRQPISMMGSNGVFAQALADNHLSETARRVRRRGKYTPQEREMIRRERNRIHAKKTRDKKKVFLEASETMIRSLEDDVYAMRDYLVKCNLLSTEELKGMLERDRRAEVELASVKDPVRTGSNALVNLSSWDADGVKEDAAMDAAMSSKRARAGNNMMQALFNEAGNQELGATDDEEDEEEGEDDSKEQEGALADELITNPRRSGRRTATRSAPTLSSSSSSTSISDMTSGTSTTTSSSSANYSHHHTGATISEATSMSLLSIGHSSPRTIGASLNGQDGAWSSVWSMGGEAVDSSEAVVEAAEAASLGTLVGRARGAFIGLKTTD